MTVKDVLSADLNVDNIDVTVRASNSQFIASYRIGRDVRPSKYHRFQYDTAAGSVYHLDGLKYLYIEKEIQFHEADVPYKGTKGFGVTIETAVLRCIRTGTAQASGNMTIQAMMDNGWDLIRVSAHLGARYGDGGENPGNHAWWQGKLYSLSGTSTEYPPFRETTGYGTGPGLSGWNCRHSFGPGDPEHNPFQSYDDDENKKAYDLSQVQRSMERGIRKAKHKAMAAKAAVDAARDDAAKKVFTEEYEKSVSLLQALNKEYQKFCKDNGLRVMTDRLNTAKWNREQAKAALRTEKMMDNRNVDTV